ncbi:hypothetical protein TcCL_ESM05973 [Trypanosoma cruzi]|nr:hypothetical protein TcCL_ESM05973 [Trypanosoma cruzi]
MEGSRLWDLTSRVSALVDCVDGALCVFDPLPKHLAIFLPVNGKIHRHAEGVVGDFAARNGLKALQSGSADCKDPAALGILLAFNFFCLSVGWCRLPESVLARAQPSMSLLLCAAPQCLSRC